MKSRIKLFDPHYGKAEEKAILKVLRSGYWASGSGLGNVEYFEKDIKKYIKSKDCIAVNSGSERFAKITNKVMIIESRGRYAKVV